MSQLAITCANVDPDLCRHMASLGSNEFNGFLRYCSWGRRDRQRQWELLKMNYINSIHNTFHNTFTLWWPSYVNGKYFWQQLWYIMMISSLCGIQIIPSMLLCSRTFNSFVPWRNDCKIEVSYRKTYSRVHWKIQIYTTLIYCKRKNPS